MTRIELLERAKPILFNTEMVRAILGGRKTVTRRVIKSRSPKACGFYVTFDSNNNFEEVYDYDENEAMYESPQSRLHIGDILYVRETWCKGNFRGEEERYYYRADNKIPHCEWHPSIHMPKEAARIFLRVTGVHVERLQDCGNMQAKDEGCNCCSQFVRIWDSTIKKSDLAKYGWAANPWVWVIEFERVGVSYD